MRTPVVPDLVAHPPAPALGASAWPLSWRQGARGPVAAADPGPALPATVAGEASSVAAPRTPARRLLRLVRDLAIGFALVAAIPLGVIQVGGPTVTRLLSGRLRAHVVAFERLRPLTLPVDRSITPEAAGRALHRLLPTTGTTTFPTIAAAPVDLAWTTAPIDSTLFAGLRSGRWRGPEATKVITAAAQGLPAREKAWLRDLAALPLWRDVDLVARAERIDALGQRFQQPFRRDAWWPAMPIPKLQIIREVAQAGVARAAHYVAIGEPEQAEAALRAIVSLGFAMSDNGASAIEGIMGRVVANIGRDGLRQLYASGHHPERLAGTEAPDTEVRGADQADTRSLAEYEQAALRDVTDPRLPLTFRFEQLGMLSHSTCGSAMAVLRGPSAAAREAHAAARTGLARFPSESALVTINERAVSAIPEREVPPSVVLQLVQGAANVTGTVTGNARIASCTRLIIGDFHAW